MILYVDTSALVKLFIDERGSDEVLSWAAEAGAVALSLIHISEPTRPY